MQELKDLKDSELVEKYLKSKDKKYFGEVYERCFKDVYRVIYSRCGNKEITEDVVSETFFTLIEILGNFNGKSALKTFIIGIGINKLRQYYYRNSKEIKLDEEDLDTVDTSDIDDLDTNGLSNEDRMKIRRCIDNIESPYKEVLQLRFIEARNINQTAEELNLTTANVRVIQHRAIDKIRKIFLELNIFIIK